MNATGSRWANEGSLKDYARCVYFESQGSLTRIVRTALGLVVARFKYNIGPMNYSLFRFSDVPQSQWRNFVTDKQMFVRIFKKHVSSEMNELVDNKALFYRHCTHNSFPTIPIIGGLGHLSGNVPQALIPHIDDLEHWTSIVASMRGDLFIKPLYGAHGDGAFAVRRTGQRFVFGPHETDGSSQDLYRYLLNRLQNATALLVQPRVRAHRDLLEISSANGLSTVRVVTAFTEKGAEILFAATRLSVGTNVTDNFSKGSSGNLAAAIDIATGTISEAWGSARDEWPIMRSTDFHPDTGKRIQGAIFPLWQKVLDLALDAQNSLPELRTVGWDIAVTDDGVLLVEANCYYGVAFLEVAYQHGLWPELTKAYK